MTRLRAFGASAKHARLRPFGTTATQARLRARLPLLLLVAALGLLAARPAAAQTELVEYYGHDALGSIRIVFTASGVATARADYEPFGEGVTIAGMPAGPLPAQQFTGQERDALERQDYFGARYYRPRHGRFSQVDPVWGNLFDPQQLNRYAYVGNSPLRYVDPDGRMRLDADCQQLDLTFAKCAAYKAPDSFLAGVFGWQQFLRQGPTFSGGGPGGRRPKGPTEGGPTNDGREDDSDEDGNDLADEDPKEPDPCHQPALPLGADVRLNSQDLQRVARVAPFATLLYWFDGVAPGGRYDYKTKGRRYEVGGNFNYGATGRALGIPGEVLLGAAGAVQTLTNAANVFLNPALVRHYFNGTYTPGSYFDDRYDQSAIKAGVEFTEAGCAAKD